MAKGSETRVVQTTKASQNKENQIQLTTAYKGPPSFLGQEVVALTAEGKFVRVVELVDMPEIGQIITLEGSKNSKEHGELLMSLQITPKTTVTLHKKKKDKVTLPEIEYLTSKPHSSIEWIHVKGSLGRVHRQNGVVSSEFTFQDSEGMWISFPESKYREEFENATLQIAFVKQVNDNLVVETVTQITIGALDETEIDLKSWPYFLTAPAGDKGFLRGTLRFGQIKPESLTYPATEGSSPKKLKKDNKGNFTFPNSDKVYDGEVGYAFYFGSIQITDKDGNVQMAKAFNVLSHILDCKAHEFKRLKEKDAYAKIKEAYMKEFIFTIYVDVHPRYGRTYMIRRANVVTS